MLRQVDPMEVGYPPGASDGPRIAPNQGRTPPPPHTHIPNILLLGPLMVAGATCATLPRQHPNPKLAPGEERQLAPNLVCSLPPFTTLTKPTRPPFRRSGKLARIHHRLHTDNHKHTASTNTHTPLQHQRKPHLARPNPCHACVRTVQPHLARESS